VVQFSGSGSWWKLALAGIHDLREGRMRAIRGCVLVPLLLMVAPVYCQQSQTPATPAFKDPEAVTVLNKALTASGGVAAFAAITDYTATGTVTYPAQGPNVTGNITIKGKGLSQFRLDEVLPSGTDSQGINDGLVKVKSSSGEVLLLPYPAPPTTGATGLPWLQIASLVADPNVVLIYKGIVTQNGTSLHDIVAMRIFPAQPEPHGPFLELGNAELFIDASTLQLASAQDTILGGGVRSIAYSNYKVVSGIAVPFSVTEQVGSVVTRQTLFSQINFNTGLQDSVFDLDISE
jgi:hypothetical protein